MAKLRAQFVTEGENIGTPENPKWVPSARNVPGWDSWSDVTGQPDENRLTDPNVFIVEVTAEQAVLDAIADAGHTEIWREEIPDAGTA